MCVVTYIKCSNLLVIRFIDLNSNLNVAGLEIKQLRAGGLTNFVDVFEKLGKQMQDRIAAAEKPEKSRTAEVTHFDMRIQISVYFGSQWTWSKLKDRLRSWQKKIGIKRDQLTTKVLMFLKCQFFPNCWNYPSSIDRPRPSFSLPDLEVKTFSAEV